MATLQRKIKFFGAMAVRQTESPTDHFDFESEDGQVKIEIKTRNRGAEQYEDDMLIAGKIAEVQDNIQEKQYFAAFYYQPDGVIKVYYLNNLQSVPEEFCFRHPRTRQYVCKQVYKLKRDDYLYKVTVD